MARAATELGVAALASLALAVGLTWPAAAHLGDRAIGHPGADVWNHLWGYAWVADELAQGRLPVRAEGLRWPDGGSLWFIDAAQAAVLAPVTRLWGAVPAYDIAMILGLAGACLGAWVLARRVCGDASAAAVGAAIYGASPHLLAQAHNGISETLCAGWLPLTLWGLLRVLERPSAGRAAALAALAAVTGLTSWYYGLFAAIAGGALLVAAAWRGQLGRALPYLLGAALAAGLALAPTLSLFRATLDAPDAVVTRDLPFVAAQLDQHNLTDLLAFFTPGRPSPDLKALFGEDLLIVVYLGWVGLLLSVVALVDPDRRRGLAPWVVVAAVAGVFSLGPWLYVGGEHALIGGRRVPLPFLPLFDAIPLFARISHPFRFVVAVSLAIAVLASCGLERLLRGRPRALAGLAVALILAETAALSPAPVPVATSDARLPAALRALPVGPGAVLDLPLALGPLERGWYSWLQVAHGRPVPWGLNEPLPPLLAQNRLTATLHRLEGATPPGLPESLPVLELSLGARELERLGLAAIVVHAELYPPARLAAARAVLEALYGPPVAGSDEALLIYAVAPAQGRE